MASFDPFKLRPASGAPEAIQAALEMVIAAEAEQAALLRQAREDRDRLLLDGTPAALAKAQAAITAAAEPAEQAGIMREQLELRLAIALEAEKVAAVAAAAAEAEAAANALSKWWVSMRRKLATELAEGMRLKAAASDAAFSYQMARRAGEERYPHQVWADPKRPTVDAGDWDDRLAAIVGSAHIVKGSVAGLLTACDPRPPGTYY